MLSYIRMRVSFQSVTKRYEGKLLQKHFVGCTMSCRVRFYVYV